MVTLVYPGVRLLDVTGPAEVFASANDFGGRYRLHMVSLDGRDVETSAGTRLSPDGALAQAGEGCAVAIIPGGPRWEQLVKDPEHLEAVRILDSVSQCTASVCTGAFLLAAAGLLDGRRATTHWAECDELGRRYPRVSVDPGVLYVDDGDILTSAGSAASIDLCLHVIRSDHGSEIATQVARDLVVPPQRTVGHFVPGMPMVYATPMMILEMEMASGDAIRNTLPPGWVTVGTEVDIRHLAATPVGATVRTTARVIAVERRVIRVEVEAFDDKRRIGEGRHARGLVNVETFTRRLGTG